MKEAEIKRGWKDKQTDTSYKGEWRERERERLREKNKKNKRNRKKMFFNFFMRGLFFNGSLLANDIKIINEGCKN